MKKALCAFLPLLMLGCGMQAITTKDLCDFKFPYDTKRYQNCMNEQVYNIQELYDKLVYYGIINKDGKTLPYAKSKVEYKIFNRCWIINQPDYWLTNYCFDSYLEEYERTGRWGLNCPAWQW